MGIITTIKETIESVINNPWTNWSVEKKREKLKWRKGFIQECKRYINEEYFNPDMFREQFFYFNLKPHLSEKLKKKIEEKRYTPGKLMSREEKITLANKKLLIKKKLFDEINILERKWGLI